MEVFFLLLAIIFISVDWYARASRRNWEVLTPAWLTAAWLVEIVGLVLIILAFGKYITHGYGEPNSRFLPVFLFGAFAFITWIWELIIIRKDPVRYLDLLSQSVAGNVAAMKPFGEVWTPSFRKYLKRTMTNLESREKDLRTSAPSIGGWSHLWLFLNYLGLRGVNMLYLEFHQLIGLHLCVSNPVFALILVGSAVRLCESPAATFPPWMQSIPQCWWSGVICIVVAMLILLGGPDMYSPSGNNAIPVKRNRRAPFKDRALRVANIVSLCGMIWVYFTVNIHVLILLMLIQQFMVTLFLMEPTDHREEQPISEAGQGGVTA